MLQSFLSIFWNLETKLVWKILEKHQIFNKCSTLAWDHIIPYSVSKIYKKIEKVLLFCHFCSFLGALKLSGKYWKTIKFSAVALLLIYFLQRKVWDSIYYIFSPKNVPEISHKSKNDFFSFLGVFKLFGEILKKIFQQFFYSLHNFSRWKIDMVKFIKILFDGCISPIIVLCLCLWC